MPTKASGERPLTRRLPRIFTVNIIIACVIMVLLFIMAIFLCFSPPMKPVSQISDYHNFRIKDGIANDTELQQTFVAPANAGSLGIYFNNYDVFLESGYLDIKVTQDSSEIFHQSINVDQLQNGQFFYIDCNLIVNSTYELTITVHDLEDIDRIAFMITDITDSEALIIDGERQNSSLVLSYVNYVPDHFAVWYCIFGITLAAIYVTLFVNREAYGK